jgi:hypothetical protein
MSWFSCWLVELTVEFGDGFVLPINLHLDLAFLRMQHDRLLAQLEQEIDRLVYTLYGLTPAEIKLVEESASR